MSEERTRELPNKSSFEERVFARFDAMDARFDAMDARFDGLEARVDVRFNAVDTRLDGLNDRVKALEAKALDTKPIWERALAEIFELRKGVEDLNRKFDILTLDVMQVRGDQRGVNKRMDELELRSQ